MGLVGLRYFGGEVYGCVEMVGDGGDTRSGMILKAKAISHIYDYRYHSLA